MFTTHYYWSKTLSKLQIFENVSNVISKLHPKHSVLCFNPDKVRQKVMEFQEGFPGRVSWSVKSNPHSEVVRAIVKAGISEFDVASRLEIEQIRNQCPSGILHFNHPVKPPEEIVFAYETAGIRSFVVDDLGEVEKLRCLFQNASAGSPSETTISIRFLDPGVTGSKNYDFGTKFGASFDEAAEILRVCAKLGFKVGLTFHAGSQNRNPEFFPLMMAKAKALEDKALQGCNTQITILNVGGGFPCIYPSGKEPSLSRYFESIRAGTDRHSCQIMCEPGRALVADSISLLTRINLKREHDTRLYINDGFYGSFMELKFVDFMPPAKAYDADGQVIQASEDAMSNFSVWGPTCDSIDQIPKPIRLPSKIRTGDYIEFGLMGAYTNATYTRFNGICPAEMVIVNNLQNWGLESYS